MNKLLIGGILLLSVASIFLISKDNLTYSPPTPTFKLSLPDLIFTNLAYNSSFMNISTNSSNSSVTYWNVSVLATLKNIGMDPSGSSITSSGINRIGGNSGGGRIIQSPSLIPGESTVILENFIGYTGQYAFWMVADVFNGVTESNETNNRMGTSITLR